MRLPEMKFQPAVVTLFVALASSIGLGALPQGIGRGGANQGPAIDPIRTTDAFFTDAQASRGKALVEANCLDCHTLEPGGPSAADVAAGKGMFLANGTRTPYATFSLVSARMTRWQTVGDLYELLRRTTAAGDAGTRPLTATQYADIVAFLLKANGFAAGREALLPEENLMRSMNLHENGFEPLFNGRDFTCVKFMLKNDCLPPPSGCAQVDAGSTFRVEQGALVNTGRPQGYWYVDKKYLNFTLRFDYRWSRVRASGNVAPGNSGYFLFIKQHQVWPEDIEIQGAENTILSVMWHRGEPPPAGYNVADDRDARQRARRPAGEWSSVEIVSKNGEIKSLLNGVLVSTITGHGITEPGYLGFQSERPYHSEPVEIQWRNVRIREE